MAMQFEVGNILLRIDDVGLLIHNTADNGNIQLSPKEGNMFIRAWAMSQGALMAQAQMHTHIIPIDPQFIPEMDEEDDEHDA